MLIKIIKNNIKKDYEEKINNLKKDLEVKIQTLEDDFHGQKKVYDDKI